MAAGRRARPAHTVVASADRLKDLEWLIGQWRPDSPTESRQITFAWLGEKNFIKNTYRSGEGEKTPLSGEQSSAGTPSWAASSPGTSTPRAVSATTSGPRTARSG